jgi:cytochrome c-type biogenesis protein CcmE
MKLGTILSIVLVLGGAGALSAVFVQNASPYVTVDQAVTSKNEVHVTGEIIPGSLQQQSFSKDVRFELKDDKGSMKVLYNGPTQSNLGEAKKVVVIGTMNNGVFESKKMLVKCPSKYESDKKPA